MRLKCQKPYNHFGTHFFFMYFQKLGGVPFLEFFDWRPPSFAKSGFQNPYFAIKVKIPKCSKLLSDNFSIYYIEF